MPVQQKTFRLVPTTLVNKAAPRPPMTSKAVKKAYREANRVPKISKAEQRRLEAAEIARQKKEYEKEKAAAKAKIAREKKAQKEADQRAKRKELGLPEPSRFVRPSQPTIKTFVKSGAGQKRSWEEAESKEAEDTDPTSEAGDESQLRGPVEPPAKRAALEHVDDEDEFGDFPSLSQADLPRLFAEPEDISRSASIKSSRSKLPDVKLEVQCEATSSIPIADQANLEVDMAEGQLLAEGGSAGTIAPALHQSKSSAAAPAAATSSDITTAKPSTASASLVQMRHISPAIHATRARKPVDESTRVMPPPAVPMTVNRLKARNSLRNAMKPLHPAEMPPVTSSRGAGTKANKILRAENFCTLPPSTLAFLEVHLDDFYPSPSQQIRELLEDDVDLPSNTQITREIGCEQKSPTARVSYIPSPPRQSQTRIDDDALRFLSSQDLEISSQDLRDIDTPSKGMSQCSSLARDVIIDQKLVPEEMALTTSRPIPKSKPRFFEEKEDDLLHAALHESLVQSKQTTQSSSPRRSRRIFQRTLSARTENGCDHFGSDGSDIDADFLALLDG